MSSLERVTCDVRPRQPWTPQEVSRLAFRTGAAALAVGGCWVGVSGTGVLNTQLAWLCGAIAAAVLVLLAAAEFLLAGTRRVQSNQRELIALIRTTRLADDASARAFPTRPVSGSPRVAAAAMTRHHTPTCPLVQGKPVDVLDDRGLAARRPCGMCA
ncbi:MAG: hypothetical protein ABR549_07035 [Mycobacteriales bacterium]